VRRSTAPPDYVALAQQRFGGLPVASTLIVGDSHVQDAHFGEVLGHHSRRGIGGMTIAEVASVLPIVASPDVERLLLWCGTNDALVHRSPDQMTADVAHLLDVARAACPRADIALVGSPSPTALAVNPVLAAAGVPFIDVQDAAAHTSDGVHLTGRGYALVNEALRQAG
jgi:lysophospholipase L1-like esterase